jgi:hypothetical protein
MRHENEERDLQAIEAAVAGDRSDAELAAIVEEARASAPRMSPAFAQRLDDAVAEGFVRPSAPRRRLRFSLVPALGLAGATAAAVAVAIAVIPGGGSHQAVLDQHSASAGSAGVPTPPAAGGAAAVRAPKAADATPTESLAAPSVSSTAVHRVQERAAELTMSTPAGRLQDTADRVVGVTDRVGGYVQGSNVEARGRAGEATFDLRIPASRLDEAMAALSRLGHVRGRSEQARDITATYDSARSRVHDAEAERSGLLRALAGASTAQEIDSLKARLRIVGRRLASARTELSSVRHRANYSRVDVTLLADGKAGGVPHGGGSPWTPGQALHDAVGVLSVAAGVVIVAAAGSLPLALLALLGLLVGRAVRRRRRDAALV